MAAGLRFAWCVPCLSPCGNISVLGIVAWNVPAGRWLEHCLYRIGPWQVGSPMVSRCISWYNWWGSGWFGEREGRLGLWLSEESKGGVAYYPNLTKE